MAKTILQSVWLNFIHETVLNDNCLSEGQKKEALENLRLYESEYNRLELISDSDFIKELVVFFANKEKERRDRCAPECKVSDNLANLYLAFKTFFSDSNNIKNIFEMSDSFKILNFNIQDFLTRLDNPDYKYQSYIQLPEIILSSLVCFYQISISFDVLYTKKRMVSKVADECCKVLRYHGKELIKVSANKLVNLTEKTILEKETLMHEWFYNDMPNILKTMQRDIYVIRASFLFTATIDKANDSIAVLTQKATSITESLPMLSRIPFDDRLATMFVTSVSSATSGVTRMLSLSRLMPTSFALSIFGRMYTLIEYLKVTAEIKLDYIKMVLETGGIFLEVASSFSFYSEMDKTRDLAAFEQIVTASIIPTIPITTELSDSEKADSEFDVIEDGERVSGVGGGAGADVVARAESVARPSLFALTLMAASSGVVTREDTTQAAAIRLPDSPRI